VSELVGEEGCVHERLPRPFRGQRKGNRADGPCFPSRTLQVLPGERSGGPQQLQAALTLTTLDPNGRASNKLVLPILIEGLKPDGPHVRAKNQILQALDTIGTPAGDALVDALDNAKGRGAALANYRKALLDALKMLGKKAYSEANVLRVRWYTKKENELYQDVRDAAAGAIGAMNQ
jgi:hypothetical protein